MWTHTTSVGKIWSSLQRKPYLELFSEFVLSTSEDVYIDLFIRENKISEKII